MRAKILIIFLLSLALISCQEGSEALDVAMAQEPPTLDVMINSSLAGRVIAVGNVYEKLLDSLSGEIVPELAEDYRISEDGRRLEFTIREGVRFHDGSALDAEDALLSMNRWLDKYAAASSITGGARFRRDGNSIFIEAEKSLALLPVMIASSPQSAVIYPSEYIDDVQVANAPGTGPYRIEEWRQGERITLSAYEDYTPHIADKTPSIKRINYIFVPDGTTRRLGLETGLYDVIDQVLSDDIPRLKEKGLQLLQGGENGSIAVLFNKKEGIAESRDFRAAVALLSDRDTLMKACYGDYGYNTGSQYMEGDQGLWQTDASDPYGYKDPEAGKRLLSSSYSGERVRILTSNLSNLDKIAVALSSELEASGVDTEVTVLDWASFLEKRKDPSSWDISVSALSRVSLPLMKSYLSSSYPGGLDTELLDPIAEAESLEEASALWSDVQLALWEEVPVMIAGHYSTVFAARTGIEGIIVSEGLYFWDAEL